jgi:hypothetical protein
MLLDRRILIEKEIAKLKKECAEMYLELVVHNNIAQLGDIYLSEYYLKREKLSSLQTDLMLVNHLIESQDSATKIT